MSDQERFYEMKKEVDRRIVDWWFTHQPTNDAELLNIIELMKKQFVQLGPFNHHFVKESHNAFKKNIFDIPLHHCFIEEYTTQFSAIGLFATNGDSSIINRSIFDYFNEEQNVEKFKRINLSVVCVQRANNNHKQSMVTSIDCVSQLIPMAYYDYPPGHRFIEAMNGYVLLEQSLMTFHGHQDKTNIPYQEALMKATNVYNALELGMIEEDELIYQLKHFF